MTTEPHAYDLSQYQRLIGVDGGRVTGTFWVLSAMKPGDTVHVKTVNVTVWDDEHRSGRILYSDDLTAFVRDGQVEIPPRMVTAVLDGVGATGAMEAAILAVVQAYLNDTKDTE